MSKIHLSVIIVHTTIHWVKPTQPAEPIFLTPTLLMGPLLATPAELARFCYENLFAIFIYLVFTKSHDPNKVSMAT